MSKNKQILSLALFLTLGFSAVTASGEDVQKGPDTATLDFHANYEALEKNQNRAKVLDESEKIADGGSILPLPVCVGDFKVDFVSLIGDPHLNIGDEVRIMGPIPGPLDFIVTPICGPSCAGHPWDNAPYIASPSSFPGWWEMPNVKVIPPEHSPAKKHAYHMLVDDWNVAGCPTHVWFRIFSDEDSGPGRHPGHAGASIN